jgi:hypothetical protein
MMYLPDGDLVVLSGTVGTLVLAVYKDVVW